MHTDIPTHAVKAVIKNENGEILFLQRNPKLRDNSNWDLPGGLVESETDEVALIREVREELNVDITIDRQAGTWSFLRPLDGKVVDVTNYVCHITEGAVTLSNEHVASQWLLPDAAEQLSVKDSSLFDALG